MLPSLRLLQVANSFGVIDLRGVVKQTGVLPLDALLPRCLALPLDAAFAGGLEEAEHRIGLLVFAVVIFEGDLGLFEHDLTCIRNLKESEAW